MTVPVGLLKARFKMKVSSPLQALHLHTPAGYAPRTDPIGHQACPCQGALAPGDNRTTIPRSPRPQHRHYANYSTHISSEVTKEFHHSTCC
jgi:hypothetical protein